MIEHEVIVVGGGGAGLSAAIAAHDSGADVAIVSKLHPVRSHTGAAEGGVNVSLPDKDTPTDHAHDTIKGADYLGDAPAVEALVREAPKAVIDLEHWGLPLARDDEGKIAIRYLAGHTNPRTVYAGAETGHHVLHTLYEQVVKRGIPVYEEWYVTRLAVTDEPDPDARSCHGFVAYDITNGDVEGFLAADGVILATGGLGQVYDHTTNAVANTGDGQAMAFRAGVPLEDMEFVQFHPTTLPSTGVLISEAVRGEGGRLWNSVGERFMFERGYARNAGELASRDVVSRAEMIEIREGRGFGDDYVLLDMRHLGGDRIVDRLENIVHLARDFEGVDPLAEPMPVKPGQHFAMGGIETNEFGETAMDGLYAAGEVACVSVHGANRLGGNAIPELLVFGRRAGRQAASGKADASAVIPTGRPATTRSHTDDEVASNRPKEVVRTAIEAEQQWIEARMQADGVHHATIRSRVQTALGNHAGVFRTGDELDQAIEIVTEARERYRNVSITDPSHTFNTEVVAAYETRNVIDVALAVVLSAKARTESRGGHWRQDHPDRDDGEWLRHTYVTWNQGNPELFYRPVILKGADKTYEPKARSY